ncbi:MAG: GldG family protein [Deltaproteobacteria bacterium]|nr:GldG family protein [Deltaproteobacteria bacterium]MBW2072656.1 GldG family protein [Deltaproteobacteria bacterium]
MRQTSRFLKRLTTTSFGFLAFTGIVVLVALIGQRHPLRLDLTENKRYTLTEQSKKVLSALNGDIQIKAFFQETAAERDRVRDLLKTYRYTSKKVHFQFIDPDRQPALARQYQIRDYGTLVLEGFGKSQTITSAEEEAITNAILKLSQDREKIVYFLTGHGERDIGEAGKDGYSLVKTAIEKQNFKVKTCNLLVAPEVPEDAAVLVIAGPQKPLLAKEVEALQHYLDRGGNLLLMLDPYNRSGLEEMLRSHGILLTDDIIVDTMSKVFGADYLMPVIAQYGHHKITDGFRIACFFPVARSVRVSSPAPANTKLLELALTSQYSWAESDFKTTDSEPPKFNDNRDIQGPVPVAVAAAITPSKKSDSTGKSTSPGRKKHRSSTAELVVYGDSDFASNRYLNLQGNSDLFLNTINFLAQQEDLITIERPRAKAAPLTLTRSQSLVLFWIGILLMPAVVLAAGVAVFNFRRKQR